MTPTASIPFKFTSEQSEFRSGLRRYFEQSAPLSDVRKLMESDEGWSRDFWRGLNEQFGLCGIHIPEAYGGHGFGFTELGLVLEEMGRGLVCAPYFASTVLATTALMNASSEAQKLSLLAPLAQGDAIATLAFSEPKAHWDVAHIRTTATPSNAIYRLDGVKTLVPDGCAADLIIVAARHPGTSGANGLSLFLVRPGAKGLERRPLKTLDRTRRLANIELRNVEAELLGDPGQAAKPLALTLAQATACLANEMIGGAERLRNSALDYSKLRVQFGRPLAAFQSMKHTQADMLLDVELAKSAAYYAVAAADQQAPDFLAAVSIAKAAASEAYLETALRTIQIHGGIGFTWDNDTHLWFRRAKSSEVFLGDAVFHRERFMRAHLQAERRNDA